MLILSQYHIFYPQKINIYSVPVVKSWSNHTHIVGISTAVILPYCLYYQWSLVIFLASLTHKTGRCPPASLLIIHCKENPIYVFLIWELRGLSPNFHIHVSVSELYITRIGPHISLQQNRRSWKYILVHLSQDI